jgi:hypothetical protein
VHIRHLLYHEDRGMGGTANRLRLYEEILDLIEKKRLETHDETLGAAIEEIIIESQFQDLEAEILENPGAFEPWLIRRRDN